MKTPIHLLYIEDNPGDARLVREELRSANSRVAIQVEWVDCLEAGLAYLASHHPQAVLLDLNLPDSQGIESVERVLAQAPSLPVIVMTGQADEELGIRAMQAGAEDYLVKGQGDGNLLARAIQYAIQRKQAEIQLSDALEFTEHIVTSSPMGIFTYRLSGECLSVNAAAARMVGATVEQLRSQNFHQIDSWKQSGLYDMALEAISGKRLVVDDVHILTSFGREAWYRAQFVTFRSGEEEHLLMILEDITERKYSEAALQASERFNRETLDTLTSNIAILDETGKIVAVNRSWREFARANRADPSQVSEGANYLNVCDHAPGKDAEEASRMAAGIRAVINGEQESYSLEYPCHSPLEKRWFIARVTKFDGEGPVRVVVAHEYITERKLAEEALRESEENYRQLFEAESDAILLIDNQTGQILQANNAACALYGYSQEELLTRKNFELSAEPEQTRQVTRESPVAPDQVISIPLRYHRRKDGMVFPVEITGRFFTHQGRPVHIAAVRDITSRKQAEAALQASEKRFRTWIENSSDIVTVIDPNGVIQYESDSVKRLLGYEPADLIGRNAFDFIHPDDREKTIAFVVEGARNVESTSATEFRFLHCDGSWRILEAVGRPYIDEQGLVLGLVNSRDITDRKQAEAALEASEKRFRSWIENSSDLITVVDFNGSILYESPSIQSLLGYAPDELLGKSAFDLVVPEDQPILLSLFVERIQKLGLIASAEYRVIHRDGSLRYFESLGRSYTDEHGKVVALIHSRDVTRRKQAEDAIAAMQKRFQALIENAPDGIALLGKDGRLHQVTPSTYQILGYTPQEAEGQEPGLLTHPEDLPGLLNVLNDLAQEPGKVVRTSYRFKHKNGSWRWLESTISNLISEPGVESIVFNYRDITDRKQAEIAIQASEQRYRELAENFPNGVVTVYNRDLVLIFDAGLELKNSGYTAEDFLGKHFTELAPPETWETARAHLLGAFEGRVSGYEASGLDGQHYSVNVAPLHDANGEINEVLVVSQNITSLKNAQSSLREKERLLSEAQRIGHIGSWSYEICDDAMQFSDEMYRLLDVVPDEFSHNSQGFLALIYPTDRAAVSKWLQDIRTGVPAKEMGFRVFHRSGELRYLQSTGAISFDKDGTAKRFIGTMQDVTERRTAEMQIEQHIKRLTALNEIDRAIISSFGQKQTLDVILKQTISQLQVDAADVLLVDQNETALHYAAGRGFQTRLLEAADVRIGESYAGRIARERHMVRIMDLAESTNDPAFDAFVKAEGFVSYIGVPLFIKGKVRGVLELYQRTMMNPYPDWLDFLYTLAGQTAIAIDNAAMFESLQSSNQELSQAYDATIEGWSRAMDLRDRETEGHTQRVTHLTLELAHRMGVEEDRLVHIRRGALLHDIGKLGVPDDILFKTEGLTPEEWEVMKRHPELAYEMLSPISYLKPALAIPYYHHERWDGSGYPIGLRGEQIPLEARIFAVVDVWDALRSHRPYRKAWEVEKVIDYITGQAGSQFDPRVVECFLKVIL